MFCKVDGKILNFFEIYGILKFEGILVSSFLVVDKKGFFRFLNEELRIIKRVLFFFKIDGNLKIKFVLFYSVVLSD